MFTQEVNVEAMYRATALMFGDEASIILAKLADVIDKAMVDGYEQGLIDGHENLEAACDASFDSGFEHGEQEGRGVADVDATAQISTGYDEGYLDGVFHARSRPDLADEMVQDIINDAADEYFEALASEYDADNVQDSGDENDGIYYGTFAS